MSDLETGYCVLAMLIAVVAGCSRVIRSRKARRRATGLCPVVRIAVRTNLPVPDLMEAYRALPEHSLEVMGR